jgi:NAD(P)-dependent dehydrogenase (short-subunit alcohol dehydrogenase family)
MNVPEEDASLQGSAAIVTGASRGLGRHFALELAQCGAALVVVGRLEPDLWQPLNSCAVVESNAFP